MLPEGKTPNPESIMAKIYDNIETNFTEGLQGIITNLGVRRVDFCVGYFNLVSTTKDKKYGKAQREAAPGLYVLTHSSTKDKKKLLDKINNSLKMGWTVKIVK